ncbi:MAG: alpha/beta hydrolase [Chloroflexi bacterium]|nr:alpha/beta hydrolase [Chloroflexota bacterium]
MPYTTVGEERVFYTYHRGSTPQAPQVILVHGSGGSHRLWGSTVRRLGPVAAYAIDLPGHGRSGGTGCRTVPDYAAFLLGFMEAIGLPRAVIGGHSLGGAIALEMALRHPQRVSGLVLVGTGARLRVLPAILEGTLSSFEQTVELICGYAYSPHTSRELVHQGQQQMLHVTPQTLHGDFAACNAFDVMDRLEEIRCPTLVVCGTDDVLTPPKYSSFLAERIEGARLEIIERAGHMVMIENPGRVAQAITEALANWQP